MKIFPAIDIKDQRAVRLRQGDFGEMTVYSGEPVSVAANFKARGASNLHMVDLDGAKDGQLTNFETIAAIAGAFGLFTQVGGGIRDLKRAEKYLSAGVNRVIFGTAAVKDPVLLKEAVIEFGDKIAVGVDARQGLVAVSGWQETTGIDSYNFCERLRDIGIGTVIYTDISRDGMLSGPNHEAYERLSGICGLNIIASGGISALEDISRLQAAGIYGAIIGKALYSGTLSLEQALEAALGYQGGGK